MAIPIYDARKVVAVLADTARPILLREFSADSCVAATRIGLDVLAAFGVQAKALPVRFTVLNAEMVAMMQLPEDEQRARRTEFARYTVDSPGGPWMVDVNAPDDPNGNGAGHVVIGVPGPSLLVDLSADQASRPHKNMSIDAPIVWGVDPGFFTDVGANESRVSGDGVAYLYQRVASRKYTASPNWVRRTTKLQSNVFPQLTKEIIAEMRASLGG